MTISPTRSGHANGAKDTALPIFYFTKVKNVGDQINPLLISKLFGVDVDLGSQDREHMIGTGSLMGFANRHSRVWGTGALHAADVSPEIVADNVYAVRGKLSYQALRDSGFRLRDIPLGDPGILVGKAFPQMMRVTRKYRLGVCAHYVDRLHPWVQNALKDPDVLDLNVHADPENFLTHVAACEAVASSSLHGLIFAEALGVPNIWIKLSEKVLGGGFKFRDWYSLARTPQHEPVLPDGLTATNCIRKASLHDMQIDVDGLVGSFPRLVR